MDQSIFRSYDIRGIYPSQLNGRDAFNIGRAFIKRTGAKNVLLGRDMRLSSPLLFKNIKKGIMSKGANVFNLGLVPVEFIYFALGCSGDYDGAIMITASHDPKEYNGFKMIEKKKKMINAVRGKDLINDINSIKQNRKEGKKGECRKINLWKEYLSHIFSFIDLKKIKPLKVVIDAGNGMAGKVIPLLAKKLPVEIIGLNFTLDGNFPARPSNPLARGAANQVIKIAREKKADFGVLFDGDADRIFLIDEKGNFIPGDVTLLILAKYFLKKGFPEKGIAYNLTCSRAVPEFIKKWGGIPIKTKVGWANIRKAEIEKKAIMGGELSGHYSFKDNFYLDSGFIAFLTILEIISSSKGKLSEMRKELSPYSKSPEINFQAKEKEKIIKKIRDYYSQAKQELLDGLTVEYNDWWFNLRPSQTEPLLRLVIEASNEKMLNEKKKELTFLINEAGGKISY